MSILDSLSDESQRRAEFPACVNGIFMAHAGVNVLPRRVADAVQRYTEDSCSRHQEFGQVLTDVSRTRITAASLIGAKASEIALLGPTSLGLSLFANGLDWRPGDEILCYRDDYPANVYPWMNLSRRGVTVRFLEPARPGEITPELVADAITPRIRMAALASCHFLTGYRIDVDAIGQILHDRGVLFSLDAIQTLGAFPVSVKHVDFLSADAHKWLLGPLAIGVVYVRKELFDTLHPTLIGAWNVKSPGFVTQENVEFEETARRYEPGVLNVAGIYGMKAGIELLQEAGMEAVSSRILELKRVFVEELSKHGFQFMGPVEGPSASGITTFFHPSVEAPALAAALEQKNITASLREDRAGRKYIRLSPHFYNTLEEAGQVIDTLVGAL
jgi:cysteine desulfurase/selenocysteine lyase